MIAQQGLMLAHYLLTHISSKRDKLDVVTLYSQEREDP